MDAMPGVVSNLYSTIEDAWRYESDYYAYRDDLPRIGELAKSSGGSVLELGAGTGRIAIHLARMGIEVTALENSEGMLELFEWKLEKEDLDVRQRISIVKGEMRSTTFPTRFSFVLLSFNFLQLILGRKERLALLKQCHHALINMGKIYIEVGAPLADFLIPERVNNRFVKALWERSKRQWVTLYQSYEYHPARQELTMEHIYVYHLTDGLVKRVSRFVTLAVIFPQELDGLVEEAGFFTRERLGDFDGSPIKKDSRRLIWIAEKP